MRKPISLPFFTFISFLFIASWVPAADGVLFGPKQYIRTSGPPNVFTDTFMGGPGVARLIVRNGNYIAGRKVEDGVTSATITVNGVQVFGTNDFKKKVHLLESPIVLNGGNSISVVLKSSPGSHLTIEVESEAAPPTATISSAPSSIIIGDSCALSWSTENADSCTIAPAIGEVDPSGSLEVSPSATTTYTITATGPGGTASASVTVTVTHPIPTVTISADPGTIQMGQSSILSWSSSNADIIVIDQGIGSVNATGSISVSLVQTTAYTITATGPSGSVTASVTVTVTNPAPAVNISANPETIHLGQSTTLSWSSTHADTVSIEPGIGLVQTNGAIVVSPTETTIYRVTATGPGGTVADSVSVVVISQISLQITSPSHGEMLYLPTVIVQGEVINSTGKETGVIVNGILAEIYGNQFVANHVPLREGENAITIIATDTDGNSATTSITVNAAPAENYIRLTADPHSGVAPFETTLVADGSFSFAAPTPTCIGPGIVEFLQSSEENRFIVRMTTPGIYYFTIETEAEGEIYTDTVAVCVIDGVELNALLRAKWNAMKQSLSCGNIEMALTYHQGAMREKYSAIYSALGSGLPILAQQMGEIALIYLSDVLAKYRIRQDHNINGNTFTITYYIYFSKNENGLWLIEKY